MSDIALQVRSRLRVRDGAPNSTAPIAARFEPGDVITSLREVPGEAVSGNASWYELAGNRFVWSGGVTPAAAGVTPVDTATLPVATYPNGRIKVLDDAGVRAVFGTFTYTESPQRGAIIIDKVWASKNITQIDVPTLAHTGHGKLWVHMLAAAPFKRVFDAIETAGLSDRMLTCGGTFVPRHKTWDPSRGLSSHSWGIAIDLNVAWNGYDVTPPALGKIGSVRELIPFFAAEGFGWGGDFSDPDGMHFELALKKI
jgi:hypothetical protein